MGWPVKAAEDWTDLASRGLSGTGTSWGGRAVLVRLVQSGHRRDRHGVSRHVSHGISWIGISRHRPSSQGLSGQSRAWIGTSGQRTEGCGAAVTDRHVTARPGLVWVGQFWQGSRGLAGQARDRSGLDWRGLAVADCAGKGGLGLSRTGTAVKDRHVSDRIGPVVRGGAVKAKRGVRDSVGIGTDCQGSNGLERSGQDVGEWPGQAGRGSHGMSPHVSERIGEQRSVWAGRVEAVTDWHRTFRSG